MYKSIHSSVISCIDPVLMTRSEERLKPARNGNGTSRIGEPGSRPFKQRKHAIDKPDGRSGKTIEDRHRHTVGCMDTDERKNARHSSLTDAPTGKRYW